MTGLIISLFVIALCIACTAFFSASETALTAISRARIFKLEQEGNKRAKIVHKLRDHKESLIGTVLLGNTLLNIAASTFATSVFISFWGEHAILFVTLLMTVLILLFGEVMPKTFAIHNPERVSLLIAPIFVWLVKIFRPITVTVNAMNNLILRQFGMNFKAGTSLVSAADALRGTIELQHREGDIVKMDKDMLGGILDLAETGVGEVMIHRKSMVMIDAGLPVPDIIRLVVESEHSRLPFWQDSPDNIIGVLHIRNLMRAIHTHGIERLDRQRMLDLLNTPWFIPESTSLRAQLLEFRKKRQHFSLVVDEYGALLGMVTLEDILEEIVGEIDDEHDEPDSGEIISDGKNGYTMDGTLTIRDLNRHLDWNLPDTHATTIAGLLIHEARLIPEVGEQYEYYHLRFTIVAKESNQITRLHIEPLHEDSEKQSNETA